MKKLDLKKLIKECIEEILAPKDARLVYGNFNSAEARDKAIENIGIKPSKTYGDKVVSYKAETEKKARAIKSKIEQEGGKALIGTRDIEAYKKKALQQIADRESWLKKEIGGNIKSVPLSNRHNIEENKKIFDAKKEADIIYHDSLDNMKEPWKDISKKFPNYNSDFEKKGGDTDKAVNFILKSLKDKYSKDYSKTEWDKMTPKFKSMVHEGITE